LLFWSYGYCFHINQGPVFLGYFFINCLQL
jgi:hypothetical protein